MRVYNLNFYEALKVVMGGDAIKGEDFEDGIFLKLNIRGELVIVDAKKIYEEKTFVIYKALIHQKFRRMLILTVGELSL